VGSWPEDALQIDQVQVPIVAAFHDKNVFQVEILVNKPGILKGAGQFAQFSEQSPFALWWSVRQFLNDVIIGCQPVGDFLLQQEAAGYDASPSRLSGGDRDGGKEVVGAQQKHLAPFTGCLIVAAGPMDPA